MTIFDRDSSTDVPLVIPQVAPILKTIVDRMGKITQAVVLITSIVPDKQSLLSNFSARSITVFSHLQAIEYAPDQVGQGDINQITVGMRHLLQMNELCHSAGLVSDMNYQILVDEFQKLTNLIDEKLMTYCIGQVPFPFRVNQSLESRTEPVVSIEQYFTESKHNESVKKTPYIGTTAAPDIQKDFPVNQKKDITNSASIQQIFPSTNHSVLPESILAHTSNSNTVKTINGEDKKERRDAIMKTIRSKGKVTIKDISENISGCSEKTIQRDLQELIQHGVLIREGEKRWAVYKLAMKNL
jgi:DNA-binding transcriptional ArsR family regulator